MRRASALLLGLSASLCVDESHGLSFIAGDVPSLIHSATCSLSDVHLNIASASTAVSAPAALSAGGELLNQYKQCLATSPLATKMATGASLAMMGDAIAQSRDVSEEYDKKRAVSFGAFDAVYRAGQHVAFPVIVDQCRGQYLGAMLSTIPFLAQWMADSDPTYYLATLEQTLVSQLGIVPFLYYPVFFTFTAVIQGLDADSAIERAKENFIPLMKRNLLFWIPVQFVQFGFVEEGLQIPFLSMCGLAWTFILSVMAGSTKTYSQQHQNHDYCITGNEPGCEIRDDELFPQMDIEEFQEEVTDVVLHALHLDEDTQKLTTNGTDAAKLSIEEMDSAVKEEQILVK